MFESFTKPGWQHPKPEVRLAAIEELDDEAVLVELVTNDPEATVRARALARISDGECLDELAATLPQPLQAQAKAQRLAQLLPDPAAIDSVADDALLARISELAEDSGLVEKAIRNISDPDRLMDLAANHPVARGRLSAARCIDDIARLKELAQKSKHHDKVVFRHCKEILDRHHAAEKEEAERQQKIVKLTEDARSLSSAVDSPEYRARFQTLQHRWALLKEYAAPEQVKPVEDDLKVCAKRIEKLDEAKSDDEARAARIEAAEETFPAVIEELQAIEYSGLGLSEAAAVAEFGKRLDGIEDRWLAALHFAQPGAEQTKECKALLNRWREVAQASGRILGKKGNLGRLAEDGLKLDPSDYLAQHKMLLRVEKQLARLTWPEFLSAATPVPIVQLRELQQQLGQRLEKLQQQETKNLERIQAAFDELRRELDDNHFKNADRAHNRLRNLLRHLNPKLQDRHFQELRPLTARLGEIHDWQGFAIEPKKVELCEQMAALVGSPEDPEVLATRIKALQAEWKKLGPISPRRDQALWKRFHAAAEEAYEPCKNAFAEQAVLRKENLKKRMALVAQLVDYDNRMAWPGAEDTPPGAPPPDWRKVQKTLDMARAAFNQIMPVSGRGERKSRKALKDICDKIYAHIRDEYGRNIEAKKALVEKARACVEMEDLREAIDMAKAIQREWKEVGLTPRKVDRRLWKDFRGACDAVFDRLGEKRRQANEERSARAEQAKARAQEKRERWPRLISRMRACALRATDEKKAKKLWKQEGDLPKGVEADALKAWWKQGPDDGLEENELQQACIALEVLIGVESPAEDKDARMAYQMQRLVEGIGTLHGNQKEALLGQVNDFIGMRAPAEWAKRFCDAVEATRNPD